jgi:hypothetical protein
MALGAKQNGGIWRDRAGSGCADGLLSGKNGAWRTFVPNMSYYVASRGDWIGVLVVKNNRSTSHLSQTQLLDYKMIHLGLEADATDEMVREGSPKCAVRLVCPPRTCPPLM